MLAAVCMVLLVSTLLAFRPAMDKDFVFVNLDDNRYVYDNDHVKQGLTRESIAWAFASLDYDNWHPLTWLSHMLDRQIFGPESLQHPWGCHLTNILIHAVNVLVLFMALRRMTSALWPSLLVAVLFGIHPLRAESVAWISERKDVLSGLFFLLTLWAYAGLCEPWPFLDAIRPGDRVVHPRADGQADARDSAGAAGVAGLLAAGAIAVGPDRKPLPMADRRRRPLSCACGSRWKRPRCSCWPWRRAW